MLTFLVISGEGSYGEVFGGLWLSHSQVVVKVMKFTIDEDTFGMEAENCSLLGHPNLVRFYGAGLTDDGEGFFVEEFMASISLSFLFL